MQFNIDLWKDIGYTEGCLEVPGTTAVTKTPDHSEQGLRCQTADIFNKAVLPCSYLTVKDMGYARITMEDNDNETFTFYAWVDTVKVRSDSQNPVTEIYYHIDNWRTYYDRAVFGVGTVMARKSLSSSDNWLYTQLPVQNFTAKYWNTVPTSVTVNGTARPAEFSQLVGKTMDNDANTSRYNLSVRGGGFLWVVVNAATEKDDKTYFRQLCYPVDPADFTAKVWMQTLGSSNKGHGMSLIETMSGDFSRFGVLATSIASVYITPVCPIEVSAVTGTSAPGTSDNPLIVPSSGKFSYLENGEYRAVYRGNQKYKVWEWFYGHGDDGTASPVLTKGLPTTSLLTASETVLYRLMDFDRNPVWSLPIGISVNHATVRNIFNSTGGYLEICFNRISYNTTAQEWTFSYSEKETKDLGLVVTVPLPQLDVTSNSWSEYVFSGQRDYDIAKKQADVMNNLALGATSIVSSAATGALMGSAVPGIGTVAGAVGGAALGIGALAVQGGVQTLMNDRMVGLEDKAASRQSESFGTAGNGWDWLHYGNIHPHLVTHTPDSISKSRYDYKNAVYGYDTCENPNPSSSKARQRTCDALIRLKGPLRIVSLEVKGDIPTEAKRFFKDKFASGVRIL